MAKKNQIEPIKSPRGMKDILPEEQIYWDKAIKILEKYANWFGFSKIETPIVESLRLFERTTGESSEIVEKQMYVLKGKHGGETLSLRPEETPNIGRAYLEHGMNSWPQPVKLYYFGPFFRHERPQARRFRQFHQFGFEIIGEENPVLDAQLIQLLYNSLIDLGIKKINVQINSLGCSECRPGYRKKLNSYLRSRVDDLCINCQRRVKINPLRFLDCKQKKCQPYIAEAPQIVDFLCKECNQHLKKVLEFLDSLEIPYILKPHLVRGLDYYTKTVFEICPAFLSEEDEKKSQIALGAGGRYDELIEMLGGKKTPAVGGALGLERIISILKENGVKKKIKGGAPQVFLVQLGDLAKKECLKLFQDFLKRGISVSESFSKDSIKSQLKIANKVGARYAVIIGQKEALERDVILRDMDAGYQETIPTGKIINEIKRKLKK